MRATNTFKINITKLTNTDTPDLGLLFCWGVGFILRITYIAVYKSLYCFSSIDICFLLFGAILHTVVYRLSIRMS